MFSVGIELEHWPEFGLKNIVVRWYLFLIYPAKESEKFLSNLSIRVSFLTDAAGYFDSALTARSLTFMWDKVFKSGSSKIFGRQPLKNLKGIWSA